MPYLRSAGISLPVLGFLCAVTLGASVVFGMVPHLSILRIPLSEVLKDEARGGTSSMQARLRNSLVAAEVAISVVLLIGAALVVQSLRALLHQNPGFDAHHVLTLSVSLPDLSYPSQPAFPFLSPASVQFEHAFTERLRNLPGVVAVGTATGLPADGGSGSIRFLIEGRPKAAGHEDECDILTVSTTYFSTLRVPVIEGRAFSDRDSVDTPPVVVVNRAFAKTYFPNGGAIGQRIRFTFNPRNPFRQIVGIVGDTAHADVAAPPSPVIYTPNNQDNSTYFAFLIRTAASPDSQVAAARAALHAMDPQLPMINPQSLDDLIQQSPSVFLRRYPSYLIGSFAVLALILAIVGLYGLMSYSITQRTREIGIRLTLGAQALDILRLVLRQGLGAAVAGTVAGVAAGFALTRLLTSLLFGVKAFDAVTFAAVAAIMIVVALAACLIPARRATSIDPTEALRYQ